MIFRSALSHWWTCALLALASIVLGIGVGADRVAAQTISNTAQASWSIQGIRQSIASNTVSFDVAATPARLTTWTPAPGESEHFALYPSYCAGLRQTASQGQLVNVPVMPTSQLRVGQTVIVRIEAPAANRDDTAIDQLELQIDTPNGDRETLVAMETGRDTGVFLASVVTVPALPAGQDDDCRLSLNEGEAMTIAAFSQGQTSPFLFGSVATLADPFGLVFDSADGTPVNGATVSLVDAATNQPAQIFAFDGVTPYPATVISGTSATDSSGQVSSFAPGEYRFPLVALGTYRLLVTPPAPYSAPSTASAAQLAALRDPAGNAFQISAASFGGTFVVADQNPVQVDLPVDAPAGQVTVQKSASRESVTAGDAVFYTLTLRNADMRRATGALNLTDLAGAGLRLRPGSVRVAGQRVTSGLTVRDDGRGFALALPAIRAGGSITVTYAMRVRDDAPQGDISNEAVLTDNNGPLSRALASVRVLRDGLTERMTIIGRVVDGACGPVAQARGIPGVRVMLEDGSYAITDSEGRYHFEGVTPGNHVIQAARSTLPEGGRFVDCVRSSRSAGSAVSRFVSGRGGSVMRVDFHARLPEGTDLSQRLPPDRSPATELAAATSEADFMALGDGEDGFVYPEAGFNPRSPALRVAVRHRGRHRVELTINGRPVDPLSFDRAELATGGAYAISSWRGIALEQARSVVRAQIVDREGNVVSTHERTVDYATTPVLAQVVAEQSRLVADGASFPVLAVRLVDRHGRPVHAGISGTLTLDSPYETVSAYEARQSAEISGFGNTSATWTVQGDDGVALIDLAPTMVSGKLRARFVFTDGDTSRQQELEAWIVPGDQPWTLIGLAEGSMGARSVADNMERADNFDNDLGDNARVAFYAKGRVLGRYLLTAAYDSARQEADQRLLGQIDPAAYYTVFGDRSQRLYDAATRDRIYVRVESSVFYALYGDFQTSFDQTMLARYQRTVTGVQAQARLGQVELAGFAANVGSQTRRDEFQGDGTSGPYRLGSRNLLPNSEVVAIEVRDRLRSEVVLERRELNRFVDYTIDLLAGTIRFSDPVLSRDAELNPRFIVIDYAVDALGAQQWNGGLRATIATSDEALRLGVTAITDSGETARTNLGTVDVRLRLGTSTEVRAEVGASESLGQNSYAYMAQVEHFSADFDARGYVQRVASNFGVGQINQAERGRLKVGADGRVRLSEHLSLAGSAWHDENLADAGQRNAAEVRAAWRNRSTDAFIGAAHMVDRLADGREGNSTVVQAGATQRLLDNRLELTAATSLPVGSTDAIDLPARHTLGARFTLSPAVRLIGQYEIARSDALDANTAKIGAEITPWSDGRLVATLGNEAFAAPASGSQLASDAQRQFAAATLGQTVRISEELVIDATFDGSRTLAGGLPEDLVNNPAQPVGSGGQIAGEIGGGGVLGEDFNAITLGAAWTHGPWSARLRGEWRDGEFANRKGLDVAAIRQLGAGSVVGSGATWTRTRNLNGGSTEILDATLSAAHRPDQSDFAFLAKLAWRSDAVTGGVLGEVADAGRTALTATGDARSRRLLASIATNWTPQDAETSAARTEVALLAGVRHNLDQLADYRLPSTTLIGGADVRVGIGERVEVGGRLTVRHGLGEGTTSFAIGPEIGFVAADNVLLTLGYNITGFRDQDYSAARSTDRGLFATVRVKFDDLSLEQLGIGQR